MHLNIICNMKKWFYIVKYYLYLKINKLIFINNEYFFKHILKLETNTMHLVSIVDKHQICYKHCLLYIYTNDISVTCPFFNITFNPNDIIYIIFDDENLIKTYKKEMIKFFLNDKIN